MKYAASLARRCCICQNMLLSKVKRGCCRMSILRVTHGGPEVRSPHKSASPDNFRGVQRQTRHNTTKGPGERERERTLLDVA